MWCSCDEFYIHLGETGRPLDIRIKLKEHKTSVLKSPELLSVHDSHGFFKQFSSV
jgi:hypothetical protein